MFFSYITLLIYCLSFPSVSLDPFELFLFYCRNVSSFLSNFAISFPIFIFFLPTCHIFLIYNPFFLFFKNTFFPTFLSRCFHFFYEFQVVFSHLIYINLSFLSVSPRFDAK
jgi:hypothetical protein